MFVVTAARNRRYGNGFLDMGDLCWRERHLERAQ